MPSNNDENNDNQVNLGEPDLIPSALLDPHTTGFIQINCSSMLFGNL